MPRRDLSITRLNPLDINDKMSVLSDLTQRLDESTGNLPTSAVTGITFFTPQLSPTIVAATSESTQTFTVKGLQVSDALIVIKPSKQAGLSLVAGDVYVSANNTLSLTFRNYTGGGLTPTANERYIVVAFRKV